MEFNKCGVSGYQCSRNASICICVPDEAKFGRGWKLVRRIYGKTDDNGESCSTDIAVEKFQRVVNGLSIARKNWKIFKLGSQSKIAARKNSVLVPDPFKNRPI